MGFKINRVYTRKGDGGKTSLASGESLSKAAPRVVAYGEVDELNACLGLILSCDSPHSKILSEVFMQIQHQLFDIGAELATSAENLHPEQWVATEESIEQLERLCERFGDKLPELDSFILPGGSELSARLHLARTVCRRSERAVVGLASIDPINENIVAYLNRLSDLLFVLSYWVLIQDGLKPILWSKGGSSND